MLTGLLCACLGTAWAGGDPLENEWSGEYDNSGNLSIMVAPLRLSGQEFTGRGMTRMGEPMLDMTVEFRTGPSSSFAITGATSLARATGMADDLDIPGMGKPEDTGAGGIAGTGQDTGQAQDPNKAPRREPNRGVPGIGPTAPVEVGLQLRDYVVGGFDNGLFVGGHVGLTNPDLRNFRAERTTFGPMAGLKVSLSIFTVEARGGADVGLGPDGFALRPRVDFATGVTF